MSVRNCSGVSGTHMAGDMDEEGLVAFNAMAQEAMKIERLVIQQKELSKKLEQMLEKSQKSEEKAKERQKILQNDIFSYLTKNKLLKENLQGKRNTRNMMEQMTCDLERQLLLEHNDINNKKNGFLQVQHKYAEMWEQYESVYMNFEEAKDMTQMRMARQEAGMLLNKLQQDKENANDKIKQTIEVRDTEINKLLIKFAGLQHELQVVQEEKCKTETEMLTLSENITQKQEDLLKAKEQHVKKINSVEPMNVEKSSISATAKTKKADSTLGSRYKNILSFGHITLPELELPNITTDDHNVAIDESDSIFDYGVSYEQFEDREALIESAVLPSVDLSRPTTPVLSQSEISVQGNDTTVSTQEETGASEMEVETQNSNQLLSDEIAAEKVNSDVICDSDQEQVLAVGIEQESSDNQEPEQQAQSTEQSEEDVSQHPIPDEQIQQEDEVPDNESQAWDADSCQGELAIMHGQMPYFNSAVSQSSEGSNFDLLDDTKRQAYLRKLMASPEFSVEGRFNSYQLGPSDQNMYQKYQPPKAGTVAQFNELENMEEDREPNNQVAENNESVSQASELCQQETEQPNNTVSFAPMNSFFGPSFGQNQQQPQTSSGPPGFTFEAFSFGSPVAQNAVPGASFFGGGNPFGDQTAPQKESEAFNLNFDNKTNSSSIFKLF